MIQEQTQTWFDEQGSYKNRSWSTKMLFGTATCTQCYFTEPALCHTLGPHPLQHLQVIDLCSQCEALWVGHFQRNDSHFRRHLRGRREGRRETHTSSKPQAHCLLQVADLHCWVQESIRGADGAIHIQFYLNGVDTFASKEEIFSKRPMGQLKIWLQVPTTGPPGTKPGSTSE